MGLLGDIGGAIGGPIVTGKHFVTGKLFPSHDTWQRDTRDLNSVKEEIKENTVSMDDKEIRIEDIPF